MKYEDLGNLRAGLEDESRHGTNIKFQLTLIECLIDIKKELREIAENINR